MRVVNVLWPEIYAGTDTRFGNNRVDHIPGSVNLPIEGFLVDEEVPFVKPAAGLRDMLAGAGLSLDEDTVVYCRAGVRTTMGVFALPLLGWDRGRADGASLAEWASRDDTPLTTGST